jgi:putative PIN family toxin of toxin-antitoxin system
MRVVVDANVFVSALIVPAGTSAALVRTLAADEQTAFIVSRETRDELKRVLMYPKIIKLLKFSANDVERFLSSVEMLSEEVDEIHPVAELECRDPDDVKYISLALSGRADFLITGDQDLLIMGNIEGIPVISPAQFLSRYDK